MHSSSQVFLAETGAVGLKIKNVRFWNTAATRDRRVDRGVEITVADAGFYFDQVVGVEVLKWARSRRR